MRAMHNFRVNLHCALETRGLSYRAFAEKCKLSFIYIHRIVHPDERGKPDPSLGVCEKIAEALEYQLTDMLVSPREFRTREKSLTAA